MQRYTTLAVSICLLLVPLSGFAAEDTGQGLDVYILRHAETVGNVTGDYSDKNQKTFSPFGKRQVAGIAKKLEDYTFDHIICSPTWRTQHTILPHLKDKDLVAEIWPEVEECCCDAHGGLELVDDIPRGDEVEIIEEGKGHFRIRETASPYRFEPETPAQALSHLARGVDLLLEQFSQSGKKVLIINHSCSGARIMEMLLGLEPNGRFAPGNAALIHLRQRPDGTFELLRYNDEPFEQDYEWEITSDDGPPKPGHDVKAELHPRYFVQKPEAGYRLQWSLRGPDGQYRKNGSTEFHPEHGREGALVEVHLPTEGARYGELWALESRLYVDDELVDESRTDFLFPTYHSLAGTWKIKEGDNPGRSKRVFDDSDWLPTEIPGGWERDALPGFDGVAWYRVSFDLAPMDTEYWADTEPALFMGAIDDADVTYLNGKKIGASGLFPPEEVTAWDQPRLYPFDPSLLRTSNNVIAVRVSDWGGGGGIWRGPVAVGSESEFRLMMKGMAD